MLMKSEQVKCLRRDPVAAAIAENDRCWKERIERYAEELYRSWHHFEQLIAAVDEDLGGEISEDEWGDLSAGFKRLRRLGVQFDPTFIEHFEQLNPVPCRFDPARAFNGIVADDPRAKSSDSFVDDDEWDYFRHMGPDAPDFTPAARSPRR